jgi:hypothetical protein
MRKLKSKRDGNDSLWIEHNEEMYCIFITYYLVIIITRNLLKKYPSLRRPWPSYACATFSRLSIAPVDGKQHLSEVVFSAYVGLLEKYPTFGREQPEVVGCHMRRVRSLVNHKSLVFRQKVGITSKECAGYCRDGGANCLLITNSFFCAVLHHVGDGGHPCSTLWWLFDLVRTRDVLWKSDESTKHYLNQMLLAINWRY